LPPQEQRSSTSATTTVDVTTLGTLAAFDIFLRGADGRKSSC
jgi:hypothetical protein